MNHPIDPSPHYMSIIMWLSL